MKLSPFMKEHKANLKKMSKKQLINQVLIWIELLAQQEIKNEKLIEYREKIIEKYKKLLETSVEIL